MRTFVRKRRNYAAKGKEKNAAREALIFLEGYKIVENLAGKKAVSDLYFQYF
jgi:hypothetical protein